MTVSELQAELARVNAAYVAAACEHREGKAALVQRVRALEADLATAKETCKDLEYHKQQVAGGDGRDGRETEALRKRVRELEAVTAENEGLKKRLCELEALAAEHEALQKRMCELEGRAAADEALGKRVRELEAVERGWKHLRAVFAS